MSFPVSTRRGDPHSPDRSTVDFFPVEAVRHQTAEWRGVQAEIIQIIRHDYFEYRFHKRRHLLVAVEQGARYDGETFIEGLPTSTVRNYSDKLMFVPMGRKFSGRQHPRLLTRSICVYIDPQTVPIDPDLGFAEAELDPRLLFEDGSLWQTVRKLKALIGSTDPVDAMYAEALGGVLAHELLRVHGKRSSSASEERGGLAGWQRRRVVEYMAEHLGEDIPLSVLADVVRLSPYHFVRSFKRSFGKPPYKYWRGRQIERARELLANPRASITEVALQVGFSGSSAFSSTFHRFTGQTPSAYRRSLE